MFKKIRAVSLISLLCVFVLMAPPLLLLYYIRIFGVNVIFADDWGGVSLVHKALNGTLSFSDLFAQHNEHRMPFPNLFMTAIEISTQYNMIGVMLFSWILVCLTALIIFITYLRNSKWDNRPTMLLAFLPVSLLLFNFIQWESMLWAVTSQIYLMIFATVAAFSFLERSRKIDAWFVFSLLCATLASFSFFAGLAVWPVGLCQIAISKGRSGLQQVTLWVASSAGVLVSYFWGWVRPAYHPPLTYAFVHPVESVRYFFAFIGSPFGASVIISETLGVVALIIASLVLVYAQRRKALKDNSTWLSVILFAAFFSLLSTVGRSGFGVEQALASRYTSVTSLGAIGAYLLSLSVFKRKPSKGKSGIAYFLLVLIVTGIAFAYSAGYYGGWAAGEHWRFSREISAYVLSTYRIQSDKTIDNYLRADPNVFVRSEAPFLEKNRLNVFSTSCVDTSTLTLMPSNTSFAIDEINDVATTGRSTNFTIDLEQYETLTITGWAIDKQAGEVASSVFIVIDNEIRVPVIYGLDRQDVASHFENPNLRFSGFWATFASSILVVGKHTVSLEIVAKSGHYYYYQNSVLSLIVS